MTVAEDALGNASIGLAYEVERNFNRVIGPRTVARIKVSGVTSPTLRQHLHPHYANSYTHTYANSYTHTYANSYTHTYANSYTHT